MAVLQKIRVKFGVVISVIIALALLSFIIDPSTLESALNSMSSKYDVGKVAGKKVSYTDFLEDVERYTRINEMVTGSSVQNEQTQQQIRDVAWQELVDKYLFIKNAKAAGITVGDDELVDLTSGANVSSVISQNPAFADESGAFSVSKLVEFIQAVDSDETGQLRTYWNYIQNSIYTQEFYAKYASLFVNGNYENALMLKDDIAQGNTTADINYVSAGYNYTPDSTIQVSSNEIKEYYNSHKQFYKQNANRDIEYVVFEVIPSESDIAETNDQMAAVYEEFSTAENMKNFLVKNSDRALSTYWYKEGELASISSSVSDFVDQNGVGAVSPIIREGNTFYAVKVMDQTQLPDQITVRLIAANDAASVDDVLADLRLAEPMTMTQTYLIPGCEGLFSAKLNEPQLIQTAQYGQIAAEVIDKTELVAKKQVAILEKTSIASKETFGTYYSKANRFASIAKGSYEGYRRAVDSLGVYSHSLKITEATSSYGAVDQAKEVTRWAFDAKKGKASDIITVNQNYFFIATVKDIHKEGYATVQEAAASIQDQLYFEKLQKKTAETVASKIAGLNTIEEVAEALGGVVSTRESVSFSGMSTAIEPALIGAAYTAQEGKVSGPVAGAAGVYVFTVTNRQSGNFYTEEDANNMALQKAQYASQMVLPVMIETSDTKDNRARFF